MIHSNVSTLLPSQKKREKFFIDREQVDSIRYNLVRDAGNHDSVVSRRSRRARRRASLTTWFDLHVR